MTTSSIHIRIMAGSCLLALAVGGSVGWLGMRTVGRVVEEHLVRDSVRDAALLARRLRLPLSDTLMAQLRQILGCEMAAGPAGGAAVAGASLAAPARDEFGRWLAANPAPPAGATLVLAGTTYRLGWADVEKDAGGEVMRLYLLAPETRLRAARRQAAAPVAAATVIAMLAALFLGHRLATGISRPIQALAGHMEQLSHAPTDNPGSPVLEAGSAPAEVAQLNTAFNRLLEHLRQARLQVLQAERFSALGELATSVVHECRNPLSGIKMNARILADELARAGAGDDRSIGLIVREIERLDLYFEELLRFAVGQNRGPAGDNAADSAKNTASLPAAAAAVLRLLDGRCRHAGVRVRSDFAAAPAGGLVAAGDHELRQVLLNLCLNALDAMPGGGELALECLPARRPGQVRCEVRDTGCGLATAQKMDIFAAFATTKPQGAGLGLHICRKVIEARGGGIGCDALARGACFWFELPAAGNGAA